jgi:hypothetical protein
LNEPLGVHGDPAAGVAVQERVLLADWAACVVTMTCAAPPW